MKSVNDIEKVDLKARFVFGKVTANDDPLLLERVRIRVPQIYDDIQDADLPWALPVKQRAMGATSLVGQFGIPVVDTDVIVAFENGDRYSPIYFGSVITSEDLKQIAGTTYGATYGIQDAAGNKIYVDTASGVNTIKIAHASGTTATIDNAGKLAFTAVNDVAIIAPGKAVSITCATSTVTATASASITVAGSSVTVTPTAVNIVGTATTNITVGASSIVATPASVTITSPLINLTP